MFAECQQFLISALKTAGIRTPAITTMKRLRLCTDSHIGAVLFDQETLGRSGSKRIFKNERGEQQKRRKVFDRSLSFDVIIGEYTAAKAEGIYERFLETVERGLYVDGNFVAVELEGADWVEKEDSILKAQVAVQVKVRFDGGVYRDTGFIDGGKEVGIIVEKTRGKGTVTDGEGTGAGNGPEDGGEGSAGAADG